MRSFGLLMALAFASLFPSAAGALPVPITGYDVTQTPAAGFGGWSHSYTGSITDTGRTISTVPIVDETGGSGTMNDGATSTRVDQVQLFSTRDDDAGVPIRPTITLHFAEPHELRQILIRGGDIGGNIIPGALLGATIAIGDTAVAVEAVPTGIPGPLETVDDVLDLSNTALADRPTNTVIIRDFTAGFFGFPFDQFSIAEIVVEDDLSGDVDPPEFTSVPSDFTVVADGPDGVAVSFVLTAEDDVDGPVAVECDPPAGSTFAPGETQVVCFACDAAGNCAAASFTVLVTLTASGLCELTGDYVSGSERYQALPPGKRAAIDKLVAGACRHLDRLVERLTPVQKAALIANYEQAVDALAAAGWLTVEQAATLKLLANAI
jgi:hypothetical protein